MDEIRDRERFMQKPSVLIIGGGFSGTLVAIHLLRSNAALNITLIDRFGSAGRGVAYRAGSPRQLLNVPAMSMSAFADDPQHFVRWIKTKDDTVAETDFVARDIYGSYIEETLACAIAQNRNSIFKQVVGEVVDLAILNDQFPSYRKRAILSAGEIIDAHFVILALGNFPPAALAGSTSNLESHPGYFANPWQINWEVALDSVKSLLVVGTGLTAADVIVEALERGYRGTIHAFSTLGLLPQAHKPGVPSHATSPLISSKQTLRAMLSLIRRLSAERIKHGAYWQEVFDDLRPNVQQIWRSLSLKEQRAFMRHLRPYWDVHRHRVAPRIAAVLAGALSDGRLVLHAARVSGLSLAGQQLELSYIPRGTGRLKLMLADRVINCTGPRINVSALESPLLQSLLKSELVYPDELGLGLKCGERGELIKKNGIESKHLLAIGSLRRGELWETIAVRELRQQAKELADVVLQNIYQLGYLEEMPKLTAANS